MRRRQGAPREVTYVSCFIGAAGSGRFGTVAGTVLTVLFGVLGLAFIAELLFGFVFQTVKWLLWLPGVLGMVVLGVLGAVFGAVPLTLMLIFGCLYGAVLLVGRCAVHLLRWLLSLLF